MVSRAIKIVAYHLEELQLPQRCVAPYEKFLIPFSFLAKCTCQAPLKCQMDKLGFCCCNMLRLCSLHTSFRVEKECLHIAVDAPNVNTCISANSTVNIADKGRPIFEGH